MVLKRVDLIGCWEWTNSGESSWPILFICIPTKHHHTQCPCTLNYFEANSSYIPTGKNKENGEIVCVLWVLLSFPFLSPSLLSALLEFPIHYLCTLWQMGKVPFTVSHLREMGSKVSPLTFRWDQLSDESCAPAVQVGSGWSESPAETASSLSLALFLHFCFPLIPFPENAAAAAKSLQLCRTLCDPLDSSPPGSAVHGILQAKTLECVTIAFSSPENTPSANHSLKKPYLRFSF